MGHDFIADLLHAVTRVVTPDKDLLKEILIVSGMPEKTENLRYMSYNCQVIQEQHRNLEFAAVAVINNRRAAQWQIEGFQKKISQIVFSTRWTRNPLDLFLNNLRCDYQMMDILTAARADYTLLGILQIEQTEGKGLSKRKHRHVRPLVAVPGIGERELTTVVDFELRNEIRKSKVRGLPLYCKVGKKAPA